MNRWYAHWVAEGFTALEAWSEKYSSDGLHLYGAAVSVADVCLVPQMYNARRFDLDLQAYPRLVTADEHLRSLPAFAQAAPELQPDAA